MKIHFFDPFANIWPHSFPVLVLAESFANYGHEVTIVRCDGMYGTHCVSMSEAKVSFDASMLKKNIVCRACRGRADILSESHLVQTNVLDHFVTEDDYRLVNYILAKCDNENWIHLNFRGIPVGKIASYEIILEHKLTDLVISTRLWPEFIANLSNVIITAIAAQRQLLQQKPDHVLVYNSLYSANNAYVHVAQKLGIPYHTLQGGPHIVRRLTSLTAFNAPREILEVSRSSEIEEWLKRPLNSSEIEVVSEHLYGLFEGRSAFAYSAATDQDSLRSIPSIINFDPDSKVFLALTSSEDEFFATQIVDGIPDMEKHVAVFPTQTEWLEWLVGHFAKKPHLTLIIRVHPRLASNKRESVTAPYYLDLLKKFKDLPPNVKINWPEQNISLYDLIHFVDVGLNKRSSAGVELLAFGIPVIVAGDHGLFSYPVSIGLYANTVLEYETLISVAASDGWSLDNVIKAFRWLSFLFSANSDDLSFHNSRKITETPVIKRFVKLRLWNYLTFIFLQLGPKAFEKKIFVNREPATPVMLDLIETVIKNKRSISDIKIPKFEINNDFVLENELLIADLRARMTKLTNNGDLDTKLARKIRSSVD